MPRTPSTLRRWAIPLASLAPLSAIVFAFSLGPSPRKIVADYLASEASPAERIAALEAAGPKVYPALAERVHEPGLPRRGEAIDLLAGSHDPSVVPALERVTQSEQVSPDLRRKAFEAALTLDRRRGLALAESLSERRDGLGEAARRALHRQERSTAGHTNPALR